MTAEISRIMGQRSFLAVTDDMETLAGDLSRAVQLTRGFPVRGGRGRRL